ncbi:hypothetical protein HYU95_04560 [Candidatus Daviesbacteria bacterium]|nr:hypothetical protein [Candidatus Daviesbacteria bacterium]
MNQRGFVPIIILISVLLVGAIGTVVYVKQQQPNSNSSLIPQEETLTPTPTTSATTDNPPSNKPAQSSVKPTTKPTASSTLSPTPKPTNKPTPTNTPAPAPKSSCGINVLATPLDPNSNFDNPLTVQLTYSANSVGNKYMTGAQWDFDGNGSWDTDMSQSNGSITHTFPNSGSYNVKLQLKMSDGEITPTCSKTVTVPMGITVRLTGQVFNDKNCNGIKEPDEQGVSGVTVNIFKIPEYYVYTTLTSDSNGNYNLTRVIDPQGSLSIKPSHVAAPGYKINTDQVPVALSSGQTSINKDLPMVPNENIGLCSY